MIRFGLALKSREFPYHRCLILSDTQTADDYVVLVRITTDDGHWPDRHCLLGPKDWDQLTGPSTVAYSTALTAKAKSKLELAVRQGVFDVIPSPSADLLRRIIQLGLDYSDTPPIAKRWMAKV